MGGRIADVWRWLERLRRLAQVAGTGVQCVSHVSSGLVYGIVGCESGEADRWRSAVEALRQVAQEEAATVVVESAPRRIKESLDVWGAPTAPLSLMRAVRERLDPHRILNRGRFLAGLDDAQPLTNAP
ncbi:MAG: hypothetical protein KatS3mg115_2207 [Candidatus Poribacteria bacterium]|nr:MAG: hypothetical protein KatS3mg115_2207 [Candidatus Poribacteria bacterium]